MSDTERHPIHEHVWEVTYRAPNGDDHWRRTELMTFEKACREALEFKYEDHTLIRIERVPCCTFHATGGEMSASCGGDAHSGSDK